MKRFKDLTARITYPGLTLEVGYDGWQSPPSERPNYFLRWVDTSATCNTTQQPYDSKGRKWRLSQHMVDGEVVGTAFKALLTYLEHEAREQFTFDGVSVYDSHVDIHKLVALRKDPESIVGRKPVAVEDSGRAPPRDADVPHAPCPVCKTPWGDIHGFGCCA